MSSKRTNEPKNASPKSAPATQSSQKRSVPEDKESAEVPEPSPLGQSPENPIVFCADDEVARGNMERANAEPEPQALHSAKVPGVPDPAIKRREEEAELEEADENEATRDSD